MRRGHGGESGALQPCRGDSAILALAKRQLKGLKPKDFKQLKSKAVKIGDKFAVASLFSGSELQGLCGRELMELLGRGRWKGELTTNKQNMFFALQSAPRLARKLNCRSGSARPCRYGHS